MGCARTTNMKRVILSVLSAIVVVAVSIWVAVGYQARLQLEEENQGLRQQLDQMAELAAENERLSNLVAQASQPQPLSADQMQELLRLRGEVTALRQQGPAPAALPIETRQAPTNTEPAVPTADYWPKASWAFAGYASPSDALQSALWAANKGDLRTVLGSLTGDAQKLAEALLASKSQTEIAAAAAAPLASLRSLRILNREVKDEETVVLTTQSEEEGGPQIRKAMMKKVGSEWKLFGYVP
jgi:hypothetical protein